MSRFRNSRLAARKGAGLLAAAWLAGGGSALAQVMTTTDPLAPKLESDPRNAPQFQKSNRAPYAQAPGTSVFAPAASGAGRTGYDSTNARRSTTAPKPKAGAKSQAIAPGLPQPVAVSPYQRPAAPSGQGAYAQAPGTPPPQTTIGPIRRPLPKRKAGEPEDPYAPLGLRAGSFDWFPAVELIGGYSTNPSHSPDKRGATLYTVAPELRAQSNWSRHELKGELRGSYTGYSPDETPTLSRPEATGKIEGRIDVTRDTRVELGGRALVGTDAPNSPNLPAGLSQLPLYTTFGGSAGLGHRFNRFDVLATGDIERTAYQDSKLTDGSSASNDARNYNQYGGKLRGSYEWTPGLKPFVEVGIDQRKHDLNADLFGYQRDSRGMSVSVGSTFEMTRLLTGEVSVGYVKRTYQDPRLSDLSGLIGNASLVWTVSALTTVKLTGSSTVGESTLPGVSGTFYRDVGVQIDHAFRQWLIGSLKFGFGLDTYKNAAKEVSGTTTTVCDCVEVMAPNEIITDRTDKRLSLGVGLTYKVDRNVQVKGEFRQEWLRSNVTGADFDASIFMLGLRWQK